MTANDLKREAKKHGANVVNESSGSYIRYQCEAPHGHVWRCSVTHDLVVEWRFGEPTSAEWRDEEIRDAIDRMGQGVEPCDVADCDYCNE